MTANLFVQHSSQKAKTLADARKLADAIVAQLTAAYANVIHNRTRFDLGSPLTIVGCHPNENRTHKFEALEDGTVRYTSNIALFFRKYLAKGSVEDEKVIELRAKYPLSIRGADSSEFRLVCIIKDMDDLKEKAADIVFMFEKDGFALR